MVVGLSSHHLIGRSVYGRRFFFFFVLCHRHGSGLSWSFFGSAGWSRPKASELLEVGFVRQTNLYNEWTENKSLAAKNKQTKKANYQTKPLEVFY